MVPEILQILTLLSDIAIVLFLISLAFRKHEIVRKAYLAIGENALVLSFVVSLTAVLGSLFYSEVLGLTPCKLCWFQRIFMYPLPIIIGIAMYRKDDRIRAYVLPLAVIGSIIAAWHYATQRFLPSSSILCELGDTSCTTIYTFAYGYITIPIMALTAFILMIVMIILMNRIKNKIKLKDIPRFD